MPFPPGQAKDAEKPGAIQRPRPMQSKMDAQNQGCHMRLLFIEELATIASFACMHPGFDSFISTAVPF